MAGIVINKGKCTLCGECINACPFNAIDIDGDSIEINANCKLCKLCIKKCPEKAIEFIDSNKEKTNINEYKGIMVYVEYVNEKIHPVTIELIGKAKELAEKINHPVYCLFLGNDISEKAEELLYYGVDKVFVYDDVKLKHFTVDTYANAFEDCIKSVKPSVVLVGGTSIGRSLAPKVSTRFKTGLTADCTELEIRKDTNLVQIRPAFGGNIMAQIITPDTRPQFATVRYKVMDEAIKLKHKKGKIVSCKLDEKQLISKIKVRKIAYKEKKDDITEANILVAIGRGMKSEKDIALVKEFAQIIGAQVACTRPLVENGWFDYTKQIGLSGRTVKPKFIITCGISGAVQFTAAMNTAETIIAINSDKNAPIFKTAHYGFIGDLYEIIPKLIEKIKGGELVYEI